MTATADRERLVRQAVIQALALSAAALGSVTARGATLPVPCAATGCVQSSAGTKTPVNGFVTYGSAGAVYSGNTLTVQQNTGKAILNWASFDISADGTVRFKQPSSSAIALNRIYESNPSSIFGQLTANGQVYLVNANGFVFGQKSSVNVAGLIASSLDMSDATFQNGILSPLQGQSTTTGHEALSGDTPQPGNITVEQGAQLTAADGGRLLLAGQNVTNSGTLTAPDGQVVLAAGQKLYLQASSDPNLRGLIVEVDGGGTAANSLAGTVSTPRGNVTLVGLAVNQDGRINATTSVSANGSVRLEAADTATIPTTVLAASNGGTLTIGPQSDIELTPSDTATAVGDQAQQQSQVTLVGRQVYIQGGTIRAPDGQMSVLAADNPSQSAPQTPNSDARIRVDSGTTIDLSGSSVELPMSTNLLSIQLRSNELADDPTHRSATDPLHGQTVIVDVRDPRPALISEPAWEAALGTIQETVGQRTSAGGTVSFQSEGDVVVNSGATINVSGGTWTYQPGTIQTSNLVGPGGQLYNIESADPALAYSGVLNPTYTQAFNRWGVQITGPTPGLGYQASGYVQGQSAGVVQFAAPALVLNGTLVGSAVNGPYQRSAPAAGGTLIIGLNLGTKLEGTEEYFSPAVSFAAQAPSIVVADDAPLATRELQLPVSYMTSGGFQSTEIFSDSTVTLPAGLPLDLGPGGSLVVQAPNINIDSSIRALGGSVQLSTEPTGLSGTEGLRPSLTVANGVTIDVSGQWTNDSIVLGPPGTAPLWYQGGTIALEVEPALDPTASGVEGGALTLGSDVSLKANGGGWLNSSGSVVGGQGGKISLGAPYFESAFTIGSGVQLAAFGVNGASGGSFSLSAPRLTLVNGVWSGAQHIDDLPPAGRPLAPSGFVYVGSDLFSDYGFSNVSLTATGPIVASGTSDVLKVDAGTDIDAITQSLQLDPAYAMQPTGAVVTGFSQVVTLPQFERPVSSVTLSVAPSFLSLGNPPNAAQLVGDLEVAPGASIQTDPGVSGGVVSGGAISLSGYGNLIVDGRLSAPGGNISLAILSPGGSTIDAGFVPDLRIELGPKAVIDAQGSAVFTPNDQGLDVGTVLPGGTVNLTAQRGSVVTEPGSAIDFGGSSATLDVENSATGAYSAASVGSAGGSLKVQSTDVVSLLGSLSAAAGTSTAGVLHAGSLEIDLTLPVEPSPDLVASFPTGPLTIELVSSTAGDAPTPSTSNLSILGAAQLVASGIDALTLQADGRIILTPQSPLTLARSVTLDAPAVAVGENVSISAPYVAIGDSASAFANVPPATAGSGSLSVTAGQIVLSGAVAIQGADSVTLTSSGDIQFRPQTLQGNSADFSGSLAVPSDLTLAAARIYPATSESYAITAGDTVTLAQTNASPGTPLSAAGAIAISAKNIMSTGTLLAPFGSIALDAAKTLTLAAGSVTSVSGAGMTIPYGQTQLGGGEWLVSGTTTSPLTTEQCNGCGPNIPLSVLNGVPSRIVSLSGSAVTFASGATVDLRGGGDLTAFEFVPGTGGSNDQLAGALSAGSGGFYAVLPSTRGQFAPYDAQTFYDTGLTPGQSVYLSGISGLTAGVYPLLPARYALLPGAYLIRVEPGFSSLTPGTLGALTDGTPVVAGYLTFGNTGLQSSAGYTGVAIYPQGYAVSANGPAQYSVTSASTFFGATTQPGVPRPVLPADAGTLALTTTGTLAALGTVLAAPASGGIGATIDVSAPDIEIAPSVTAPSGATLAASVLDSWGAGRLVLGGALSADDSSLGVAAQSVTLEPGTDLSAGEVLIAATGRIDVLPDATLTSTSGSGPVSATPLQLTGAGADAAALLAVSDLELPLAVRPANAGTPPATIQIHPGATVSSGGAIAIDAPGNVTLDGTLGDKGASVSLGSTSIGFVPSGTRGTESLVINPALVTNLQQAGAVRLAATDQIDLDTAVTLGVAGSKPAPSLTALTLSAASIDNISGQASIFGARTLTLAGAGFIPITPAPGAPFGADNYLLANAGSAPVAPTSGAGSVSFLAGQLELGPGNLTLSGNAQTNMTATTSVAGMGTGALEVSGNLAVTAPVLTAASRAATSIEAPSGALTVSANGAAPAAASLGSSLAGNLSLEANSLADSGAIIVPGGQVSLQAAANLTLGPTATVDTGGITVSAGGQTVGAAGGIVNVSAGGNLTVAPGALVNASGAGGAPGGTVNLAAGANAVLDGRLAAGAATGATGGSLTIDAGTLVGGLSPDLLNDAATGGFTNEVSIRTHNGDLTLGPGTALSATDITLAADTGNIDVEGSLSAPAVGRSGFIGLYGGSGVTVGGTLTATGLAGVGGHGSEIDISSTCSTCSVTLASTGKIATSGGATGGELIIEAPALLATNDVAVNLGQTGLGADVSHVGQVIITGVDIVPTSAATVSSDLASALSAASGYLAAASPGYARLAAGNPAPVQFHAGVELEDANAGETLSLGGVDLSSYSESGQVIDLTVRAAGSLDITGNISDGFNTTTATPKLYGTTGNNASGSLRLVAGADLGAADPLATAISPASVATPPAYDLTLAPGVLVRTGTGDIGLAAAQDVVLGDPSGAAGSALVYTAGYQGAPSLTIPQSGRQVITYPTDGGNLSISAGRDVLGSPIQDAVSDWVIREVAPAKYPGGQWGVNLAEFVAHTSPFGEQQGWNAATLGGGDLTVTAARDIVNLSAAVADSFAGQGPTGQPTHFGGGGLTVTAGRDVVSGQFYVGAGVGTLTAGRSFANFTRAPFAGTTAPITVGSSVALGDAQIGVWAEQDVSLNEIYDPTVVLQPFNAPNGVDDFLTYGSDSAITVQNTAGTLSVSSDSQSIEAQLGRAVQETQTTFPFSGNSFQLLPSNLRLTSLTGDLTVTNGSGLTDTLMPSDNGQLTLFAGRDINQVALNMSDDFATDVPIAANILTAPGTNLLDTHLSGRHLLDTEPVLVSAGRDIIGLTLAVPKAGRIVAGRDIVNLDYNGQNLNPTDLTLFSAGRDFVDPITTSGQAVTVGGPGTVDLLAGRNVEFGQSFGIITDGNLENPNLGAGGADITVLAGLGQNPDYTGFLDKIVLPSATEQQALVTYVDGLTGQTSLSQSQADTAFESLSVDQQRPFLLDAFFNELNLSGLEANSQPSVGYSRGYAAIDALFPGSRANPTTSAGTSATACQKAGPYCGDITLILSQVYTLAGGNISLLAPGGMLNVGLAVPPAGSTPKAPGSLGIVAEGTGNVSIYSMGDVDVNASRVFTLGGGNILIWSDQGNIDAGRGAKSSLSAPAPTIVVNEQTGTVSVNFSGAVAGSGIRTIQTSPSEPAGNVDLIAPEGFVNAGDAGIAAAGNINIAAAQVLGVGNIQFGGSATGVPATVSDLGASLSSASSVSAGATNSATSSAAGGAESKPAAAPLSQAAMTWLDVFVTGLGEENCKPDDLECLKRQKHD